MSDIHDSNLSFSSIASSYSFIITSDTSSDFAFDFNSVNIRDTSIEKVIYIHSIDSIMFDQNQVQLDSIIQAIITAIVIAVVTQASIDFTAQLQRL